MSYRTWTTAALGLAFAFAAASPSMRAFDDAHKTTYLTFNRPVRLPGVALASGTYIFELADQIGAWGIVRVSSRDRKTVYLQADTRTVEHRDGRPSPRPISFAEGPADAPLPILIWWPGSEAAGRQFIYRTN
jgi:hypothetical protein